MQKRERNLAIVVGVLVALVGLQYVYSGISGMFVAREDKITALEKEVSEKQLKQQRGVRAKNKLRDYENRSLPPNSEVARTLYLNWLNGLIDKSKLTGSVASPEPRRGRSVYTELTFSYVGEGTLEQLTRFLHEFYSVDHLHQITSLTIKPASDGKKLDLSVAIRALSLPQAPPSTKLEAEKSDRLAFGDVAAYTKAIPGRDFFTAYTPPPTVTPPSENKTPPFDAAKHTAITGVIEGDKKQAWLVDRTTGKLLQLAEGDEFNVGSIKGTIERIDGRQVEFVAEGKRMTLAVGGFLHEAKPVAQ